MTRIAIAALATLILFSPQGAQAQTLWLCSLSEDMLRLVCVADVDVASDAEPALPARQPNAIVNRTAFPLDPRRQHSVELWNVPTDMAFVEQLGRATLCYRSPACSVIVFGERWAANPPPARLAIRAADKRDRWSDAGAGIALELQR